MVRRAVDEIPDMRGLLDDEDKAILARRVLNAALDPEDGALRREIVFSGLVTHAEAKRIISALRALAQGAPTE